MVSVWMIEIARSKMTSFCLGLGKCMNVSGDGTSFVKYRGQRVAWHAGFGASSTGVEHRNSSSGSSGILQKAPSTESPSSFPCAPETALGAGQCTQNFPQDKHVILLRQFFSSVLSRCNARPLPLPLSCRRLRVPGGY